MVSIGSITRLIITLNLNSIYNFTIAYNSLKLTTVRTQALGEKIFDNLFLVCSVTDMWFLAVISAAGKCNKIRRKRRYKGRRGLIIKVYIIIKLYKT